MKESELHAAHLALQKAYDDIAEKLKTAAPKEREQLITETNRLTDELMQLVLTRRAWYRDEFL